MERFKAAEKEMKTKAFSKEGLIAAARLGPEEKAKVEVSQWLTSMVDELSRQIEAAEAEIEQSLATTKKSKKAPAKDEHVSSMEHRNERRNWHISRLEILLRMLENSTLEVDQINSIKEDIQYFVECNNEYDFEEDEGIYDEFNLDDEEEAYGLRDADDTTADISASPPPSSTAAVPEPLVASPTSGSAATPTVSSSQPPEESSSKSMPAAKESKREESIPAPKFKEDKKVVSASKKTSVSTAGSAAASSTSTTMSSSNDGFARERSSISTSVSEPSHGAAPPVPPAGSASPATVATPTPKVVTPAAVLPPVRYATAAAAAVSTPSTTASSMPAAASGSGTEGDMSSTTSIDGKETVTGTVGSVHDGARPTEGSRPRAPGTTAFGTAAGAGGSGHGGTGDVRLPDTLSDLVTSFEWAKQKSMLRESNLAHAQHTLDTSFTGGVPEPMDSERPKYYTPKDPYPTPHYYPQAPAAIFDNPALYGKFDVDTLFYIFYYQQGTYHQYLAARELKKQSWRFHKQYLTWFQRHSEPQAITDEYEQGAYVYFDWEGSWCQRRKNDFRFEYRWLEDN